MKPDFSAFSLFSPPTRLFFIATKQALFLQTSFPSHSTLTPLSHLSWISHLAFFKNLSRWPSHPGKVGSLPRRPSWPGKVENYWPIQGPNQIWLHLWTCSGYSGIQTHLLPLPIPSATVYVSPLHIIINSLMSFHVTIFFYSYLAFLQFSPFLKGLCVLIPQLEVETKRVESHCIFHLVRGQEICWLPERGQRHQSKAKPLFNPCSQRRVLQESCVPRSAMRLVQLSGSEPSCQVEYKPMFMTFSTVSQSVLVLMRQESVLGKLRCHFLKIVS